MKIKLFRYLSIPIFLSTIYLFKPKTLLELCELETNPSCYSNDFCQEIQDNAIALQFDSVSHILYNIFSVKNVFFARYKNQNVVLKKLPACKELVSSFDLDSLKDLLISRADHYPPFCICDESTFELLVTTMKKISNAQQIVALLSVNAEPVILQLFPSENNYPVPRFYGLCGRLLIEENCGKPLNSIESFAWYARAYVAYQLLEAARNFTENHSNFRLYLTDISPDNIVVDDDLKISFVDLENGVLKLKKNENLAPVGVHYTEHLEETYYYSQESLCDHDLSDHNIYGVCMLLLSKYSPWPMMQGGLLHDPPKHILDHHKRLFEDIELCVHSESKISRFEVSDNILSELKIILIGTNWYL